MNNTSYISSGANFSTSQTLKSKYGLDILVAAPGALEALKPPALVLVQDEFSPESDSFGSDYMEQIFNFHIDGFAGGRQVEWENQLLRDQIREDLRYLLTDTDYVDLYGVDANGVADTSARISDIEILDVSDENLPPLSQLAAEKYRFRVSFRVGLLRDG